MSYFHICFLYLMVLMITLSNHGIHISGLYSQTTTTLPFPGDSNHTSHRKLLAHGSCTSKDISVSQSRDSSTSGIPEYIVQIVNTCVCGSCSPSNIHLHCGWFASTRIINPMTFKRLSYDDCLVNGGKPLRSSQIIRFSYSNSFMYPLSLRHAKFC